MRSEIMRRKLAVLACVAGVGVALSGCSTDAFCFDNCDGVGADTDGGGETGAGGTGGSMLTEGGTGGVTLPEGGDTQPCVVTNGGTEICDAVDNDCDGETDEDFDLNAKTSCGTCSNNCVTKMINADPEAVTCTWDGTAGTEGTCGFTGCAQDWYDVDKDPANGCEYPCVKGADDDTLCNKRDDDCDGLRDEDVDLCTSATDCGQCGRACVVLHGTPECEHPSSGACDTTNTQCAVQGCDDDDNDGLQDWWDLDNSYATGCEYSCEQTHGGAEICGDAIDNDCDGKLDGADDDLSGDPQLGQPCFGDPDGECGTAAHAGLTACNGQQVECQGPEVIVQGQMPEICNGLDDDCNGVADDNLTDTGDSCGTSSIFPCTLGSEQCVLGVLTCVGALEPGVEACNAVDDDCDGVADDNPTDATGPCDVPVPPPAGATSPCVGGMRACQSGVVICQGSTVAGPGAVDTCGVDANCDGALTNQPDLQTDVHNCGSCGNDCLAGAVHANWACVGGACQFQGCQPNYYDNGAAPDVQAGDNKCGYACTFISSQEACNGEDDDCDGQTDEGVVAPSPVQVCGVSPSALRPECTSQVTVTCGGTSGWDCGFPAGVCAGGTCDASDEVCDTLDNDCDGQVNENTPNFGQPCASDASAPGSQGACRTTGTYVCNTITPNPDDTTCSAVPDTTQVSAELCDGVDNDCDGSVDETFQAKGTNGTYFVKPTVTKVASNIWIYTYEASRPTATSTIPGTGNGYWTSAPSGSTLDRTKACSVGAKVPWFNVTPTEVEQTCTALGGTRCTLSQWQTACRANATCTWGYNPRTAACTTAYTASKYCNLGPSFDFNTTSTGDQDGLLPTGSGLLGNCWADWSNLQSNTAATNRLFDITGNLREIVYDTTAPATWRLMGGAFNSASESGATCDFKFYAVDATFKFFDTGFRCCFSADPTL